MPFYPSGRPPPHFTDGLWVFSRPVSRPADGSAVRLAETLLHITKREFETWLENGGNKNDSRGDRKIADRKMGSTEWQPSIED